MKKFLPLLLCLFLSSCGTQSKTDLALEDTRANDDISDRPVLGTATSSDSILAVNAGNAAGSRLSRIIFPGSNAVVLAGDGSFITAGGGSGSGDMLLGTAQSVTAAKTFDPSMLLVKGLSTGKTAFASANAGASNYTATLQAATGTLAYTSDITGTNSGTNTGDNATNTQYSGLLTSKTANYVYAAPNGSAGVPGFRALVAADIPGFAAQYIDWNSVSGGSSIANKPTIPSAASDTTYDATSWDGVTTIPPSKNAVRDRLEAISSTGSDGLWGIGTKDNTSTYAPGAGFDSGFAVVNHVPQAYFSAGLHPLALVSDVVLKSAVKSLDFDWKSPVDADDRMIRLPAAITVTGLYCIATGTTPSIAVALNECDSAGANCAASGATVTANGGVDSDTTITDAVYDAGDYLQITVGAPTGTVGYLTCSVTYTN